MDLSKGMRRWLVILCVSCQAVKPLLAQDRLGEGSAAHSISKPGEMVDLFDGNIIGRSPLVFTGKISPVDASKCKDARLMIELKGGEIRITVLSEKINDGMRIDNTVIILSFGEAECRIEVGVQAEKAK